MLLHLQIKLCGPSVRDLYIFKVTSLNLDLKAAILIDVRFLILAFLSLSRHMSGKCFGIRQYCSLRYHLQLRIQSSSSLSFDTILIIVNGTESEGFSETCI
jgi:hypothetical protein